MLALATLPEPVAQFLTAAEAGLERLTQDPNMSGVSENFRGLAMSGDPVVLSVLFLLSLCAAGIAWSLLMIVARALFGPPKRPVRKHAQPRSAGPAMAVPAQARLDEGAAIAPRSSSRALVPTATVPPPAVEGVRGAFAPEPEPASRLAAAVGGPAPAPKFGLGSVPALPPPAPRALPFRKISLAEKPRLAELGRVVSARPEWTGRVSPTSLKAAGAVEQCHIAARVNCAGDTSEAVREKDFRLYSLPRVDTEGRTQPDLMVFNVSDNGILPRRMEWPPAKRTRND